MQLSLLLLELMKVELLVVDVLVDPSTLQLYDVHTSWLLDDQSFILAGLRKATYWGSDRLCSGPLPQFTRIGDLQVSFYYHDKVPLSTYCHAM